MQGIVIYSCGPRFGYLEGEGEGEVEEEAGVNINLAVVHFNCPPNHQCC